MRRSIAVVTAVLAVAGLVEAPTAHAVSPPPRHAGYRPPPIAWHKCADPTLAQSGAQCGMLVVPLDYLHPDGTKIKLAVSRVLHKTSAAKYQGVMLVNPGGPGGSGRIYAIIQGFFPDHAGDAYDWIGFDPRGVGASRPSVSCNPKYFHSDRPPYRPSTNPIMSRWVARSKRYAAQCTHSAGRAVFRHMRTIDNVRDMESLRKALGKKQINYYGFSYGTYLGQVYATKHPHRVRRFVFDGSVNPERVFYRANQDQDRAFQKTLNIYFRWLAKYHAVYHVGGTYRAVRRTWLTTRTALTRHAARGVLGGDELTDVFQSPAYYVFGWEDVARAYSAYLNRGNPSRLISLYTGANPTTPGADNGFAVYLGTQCTDARWPGSQHRLNRDNTRLDRTYNYFTWQNAWFNGPCAYWHYPARHHPVRVTGAHVRSKILMINETYDAATPFAGALVVRHLFPTASLIEGKNGSTHAGSLSDGPCTMNAIAAYLAHGRVPARKAGNRSDKLCAPVPRPNPTSAAATDWGAGQAAARALIRSALESAQGPG
jgi:pimeloyl-ACP methyl ester carboxylesterase